MMQSRSAVRTAEGSESISLALIEKVPVCRYIVASALVGNSIVIMTMEKALP
jgi:hypothetical protein